MNSCRQTGRAVLTGLLLGLLVPGFAVRAQTPMLHGTNLWKFSLAAAFPYNSSLSTPAVAPDGTIYEGAFDGTLFALTPAGREKWRFKAGREIKSSPAIADDGTIYFGARDHRLYAVTPVGKLKWTFAAGAWVDSSPAIARDGTVYFGAWDKNFYALKPDGTLKWKLTVGGLVDSSPAVAADGTIYFGAHDKKFYALTPDGRVRWTFPTGGEIISSPALGADGQVYFTSLDGNLYALNPDGTKQWQYHSGGTTESSPIVNAAGEVCVGSNTGILVLSAAGKLNWTCDSPLPMAGAQLAMAGRFYFSVPWGTVQAMTAPDQRLWQAELPVSVTSSLVVGGNGNVYAGSERFLYAIQPPGEGLPPAKSPWPMFRANARHTGRAGD